MISFKFRVFQSDQPGLLLADTDVITPAARGCTRIKVYVPDVCCSSPNTHPSSQVQFNRTSYCDSCKHRSLVHSKVWSHVCRIWL